MAKTNYLNNKDILLEIHKSKMSFCWVKSQNHYDFDIIVNHTDEIDNQAIETASINKAQKLKEVNYTAAVAEYDGPANKKPRQKEFIVDPDSFALEDIDYIKIDAEGYEIEALVGAKNLIERCKPFIHIEAKKKVMEKQNISMNDITDYFESINYEQVLSVKSELLYAPK